MDKLQELLKTQGDFQVALGYKVSDMTSEERTAYIKEYILHFEDEAHEMLRELPHFKPWKKYSTNEEEVNQRLAAARLEWIDALHFFLNVTIALGFSAEELFRMYCDKHNINHERQEDADNYKKCKE